MSNCRSVNYFTLRALSVRDVYNGSRDPGRTLRGRAQLEALYGTPVELIADADGERSAFLPG